MSKIKILYIDDEEINLRLFKINLGSKYDITTCHTGSIGLDILSKNNDIPIVVTDMRMPIMNGIEFVDKARELYPDIAYFILSGYDITEEIQNYINQGVIKKYFKKPFNLREIGMEIEKAILK